MTDSGFLAEFPSVSTQEWDDAIRKDLEGLDYSRKLLWQTGEGLTTKPYYRAEDVAQLEQINSAPGEFPYMRGARPTPGWTIREEIASEDPDEANRAAKAALASGADEIAFRGVRLANESDLRLLLLNLEGIPVHFESADTALLRLLRDYLQKRRHNATISTGWDPCGDSTFAAEFAVAPIPFLRPFTIHGETFERSGATAVQEVAFSLSAAIDFMAAMQERGLSADSSANSIAFSLAIGSTFFVQIAKFRSFRMLWAQAVTSFGGSHESARTRIHARTSRWNKTIYDPHVNVLRATSEAMAAAIGGADSISILPFDACYKSPDAASLRLARNTQLLLRHEAQLDRVADPGGGSYFLEAITDSIARESWKLMQEIEQSGGFQKASDSGVIAKTLAASLAAKEQSIASRRTVLTGTNRYANPDERALPGINPVHQDLLPRGSSIYEALRLRSERCIAQTGKTPRILLAEIGDSKMRSARSQFAADIFACAGLPTTSRQYSDGTQIALSEADLIVLCSSDPEYLTFATDLLAAMKKLDRRTPVIIAGNPETADDLKKLGIADFVHLRTNPVEFLSCWQKQLGIED